MARETTAAVESGKDWRTATRESAKNPMKAAPMGTRPSSTLSPERRPASMLPTPMPTARKAQSRETPLSPMRSTSLPKYCRSVLRSTPANQKYDTPRTASQRGLSWSRWRVLAAISAKGFQRKGWVGPGHRDARNASAGGEADGSDGEGGRADAPGRGLPHREENAAAGDAEDDGDEGDRKSTRLNSSHLGI